MSEKHAHVNVHALSHEGRGIAKIKGKTTFIRGALPGETVTLGRIKRRGKYDETQIDELITASENRATPPCEKFGVCGGCALQHLDVPAQIAHKHSVLKEQLKHFGKVEAGEWVAPLSVEPLGYRTKARLAVRDVPKKGGALVGFREVANRCVTDMRHCPILHPSVGQDLQMLRDLVNGLSCKSQIPQLLVAVDDTKTALTVRHLQPLTDDDLKQVKAFGQVHNFWMYLQPEKDDSTHLVWPEQSAAYLTYALPEYGVQLDFMPYDFTQVNMALNHKMMAQALAWLDLKPTDTVLDLFCGLGNFTMPMARTAKTVIGVEGDDAMVRRGEHNAKKNGITHTHFYASNLFEWNKKAKFLQHGANKILLDPPRAGAEAVCKNMGSIKPERIVYVSCNPATLARDVGILVHEHGYILEKAGIMDMFTHTTHVESMALLTKQ
jgi:23S rRNA (uracil1939-C5)-methyltransferase